MSIGTQYKTSNIVLNETVMGFEDGFELLGRVNHDYEGMVANYNGMPTGGAISVRTHGYPVLQTGQTHTLKAIEQNFETVTVNVNDMLGNSYAVFSTEFETDRNKVTDTVHYQTAMAIATTANVNCYRSLALNAATYVGSSSTTSVNYAQITRLQTVSRELSIPNVDRTLFINARDYESMADSINTGGIFDEELNRSNNRYMVGTYAGIPVVPSQTLGSIKHIAGTAGGKTLTFGSLVSTNNYQSAVINLTGATNGDTLVPGDRLTFAVTKLLNPISRLSTGVPLQLVVQNTVTAASNAFTNVQVVCGILDLTTSPFYGNVAAVPSGGESVAVEASHKLNFLTVKPGFTFATVGLQNISTLEIRDWYASGTRKEKLAPQSRNPNQKNAPINIRTVFDSDILQSQMMMRVDVQPVYKTFQRLNIALITQLNE